MARSSNGPHNGILCVYKPAGPTSHDVVGLVRRATGQRRVGHAGTLDPAAEGVLLVCLGTATRVVEYLMEGQKRYSATLRLGITTTTDDGEGDVVATADWSSVTRERVDTVLRQFVGRIQQVPPAYSALKVNGRPMYALARSGAEVVRCPREVDVYAAEIVGWDPPLVEVDVLCGKGTYIRAIARDLGGALGCGAHMSHLIRTASGRFHLSDTIKVEQITALASDGRVGEALYPIDEALLDLDAIVCGIDGERRILNGAPYSPASVIGSPTDQGLSRVYTEDGRIVAVARYLGESGSWQTVKSLVPTIPSP